MNRKTITSMGENKRDVDYDVQSESLGAGIELKIVDESDITTCSEKMKSEYGWVAEPPRLDAYKHFKYRTKFLVYRNGVAGKFNIHGVEVSELKVSTAFWLQSGKDYGETRLFINGDFFQSPAELSKYERIHFTPDSMYRGLIGIDYHIEVRDKLREVIIKGLLSSN